MQDDIDIVTVLIRVAVGRCGRGITINTGAAANCRTYLRGGR